MIKLSRVVLTLVIVVGSASAIHAATASWDPNPEANIAGYRLSYGTQTGVHPTTIDVGNVTTWSLNLTPGQRYYIVVQAYNSSGQLSPESGEVVLDIPATVNRAPTLTQPSNQASAENTSVSLSLVASDPDGTALAYSATGLPVGLSVNLTSGVITGTLTFTSAGTYAVTATASDGSLSNTKIFTWVVSDANRSPTLTQPANQSSIANASASFALVASDPDGTALSYSATGLPPGLAINAATGVIAGTIAASGAGSYSVTASASDGSLSAIRSFTWTVAAAVGTTTVDLAPQGDTFINLNGTNASTSYRLNTYTLPANSVANAILMKFDLSQIPASATIQSAILNLSLIEADSYTAEPTYSVSLHQVINMNPDLAQASGMVASGTMAWTANNCCRSGVPLAQADISPARWVTAIDRTMAYKTWEATSIVQAWRTAPVANFGLLLNSDATKGKDRYRFFASSENVTVAQRPFLRVTYTAAGGDTTAPTVALTAPANNVTVSGVTVSVTATSFDAVGVAGVQFRLDGVNIGNDDTTAPYSVVWDTTTSTGGLHALTAVARDAAGNTTTSATVSVTVSNIVANRAPTLTQPANQSTAENAVVSLAIVASDPDGNALTYSASGLPAGLTISALTGLISGTPTFTSAGTYAVTATASDGLLSNSKTLTWTIANTNRPPVLAQPSSQTSTEGATVSLALSASDPDGTVVTYGATGLPVGLAVNATTGLIAGTLGTGSVGLYTVIATSSDGSLTATKTFVWGVNNADVAVLGDFDGDGRADPATYRASTGQWRIWASRGNFAAGTPITWGSGNDLPVPADYDGDRVTDVAVYRPSTGTWHVLLSGTNMQTSLDVLWGDGSDRPVPIDYDGDGKADLALVRFGGLDILLSSTNYVTSVSVR